MDIRHVDLRTSRVFFTIFGQCINVLNYNIYYKALIISGGILLV